MSINAVSPSSTLAPSPSTTPTAGSPAAVSPTSATAAVSTLLTDATESQVLSTLGAAGSDSASSNNLYSTLSAVFQQLVSGLTANDATASASTEGNASPATALQTAVDGALQTLSTSGQSPSSSALGNIIDTTA